MKKRIILCIMLISFLSGCSTPYYVQPKRATEVSEQNRIYKDALEEGRSIGREKGFQEGYRRGYSEGLYIGKVVGVDSLLLAARKNDNDFYYLLMETRHRDVKDMVDALEAARERGYQSGRTNANMDTYQLGVRDGYRLAFDSLYNINLGKGEISHYPTDIKTHLAIDYEKVVRLLANIGDEHLYIEYTAFSGALHEIHTEIISYLVRRLNQDLTVTEAAEVFERYEEMHEGLARAYYRRYLSLCRTRNRNYANKSFYDYRHYTSADIFLDVIGLGITGVADVVFTYAKSNTQFATTSGFEAMGHLAELLVNEVILPVEDLLLKQALKADYDLKLPDLEASCRALIMPFTAETRTHTKKVTDKIMDRNYSAEVTMEIVTIVNLGFPTENFVLEINHNRQLFQLNLSAKPRFLDLVYQDYKVLKVKNEIYVPYPGGLGKATLRQRALNTLFERHKDAPESLDICQQPLSAKSLNGLIPTLIKAIEPGISLPVGCYQAKLRLEGHFSKEIIHAKCR